MSAFRLDYSGYARPFDGVNQGIVGVSDSEHGLVVRHEGVGAVNPTVAAASGRHDEWLVAYASCDGPADRPPCGRDVLHALVAVTRSVIELTDVTPPTSGPPGGDAVDAPIWTGIERLTASVSDVGGGLTVWSLAVDGTERLRDRIEPDSPTCVDAGGRLFPAPRPCPASADLLVDIDARVLPAGTHDMTVRVTDVAGNSRTVFSGRRTVAAPPVLGAPAPVPPVADAPAPPVANAPTAPRAGSTSPRAGPVHAPARSPSPIAGARRSAAA